MEWKTIKSIISDTYNNSPKFLKPIFWMVLIFGIIVLITILKRSYDSHELACSQNKHSKFFDSECFQKLDTVQTTITIYKDTCNQVKPLRIEPKMEREFIPHNDNITISQDGEGNTQTNTFK